MGVSIQHINELRRFYDASKVFSRPQRLEKLLSMYIDGLKDRDLLIRKLEGREIDPSLRGQWVTWKPGDSNKWSVYAGE